MTQFKNAYDLVNARSQKVKELALEIDAKLGQGSDEVVQEALDLRPALEEAEQKLNEAQDLYQQLQNSAQKADDAAFVFVLVWRMLPKLTAERPTRQEYQALSVAEQIALPTKAEKLKED